MQCFCKHPKLDIQIYYYKIKKLLQVDKYLKEFYSNTMTYAYTYKLLRSYVVKFAVNLFFHT